MLLPPGTRLSACGADQVEFFSLLVKCNIPSLGARAARSLRETTKIYRIEIEQGLLCSDDWFAMIRPRLPRLQLPKARLLDLRWIGLPIIESVRNALAVSAAQAPRPMESVLPATHAGL